MLRAIFAICLTLVLVLTSGAMAIARGQMAASPAMTLVICVGEGTETLRLDADGNPIPATHHCPDCTLVGLAALPTLPAIQAALPQTTASPTRLAQTDTFSNAPRLGGTARAPPRPI